MGADWVGIIDMDEFISPREYTSSMSSVLNEDRFADVQIIWLPSYLFNTAVCVPVHGQRRNFVSVWKSFVYAKLDVKTFKGRRKALYHLKKIGLDLFKTWFVLFPCEIKKKVEGGG